jgi:hypothetical protein
MFIYILLFIFNTLLKLLLIINKNTNIHIFIFWLHPDQLNKPNVTYFSVFFLFFVHFDISNPYGISFFNTIKNMSSENNNNLIQDNQPAEVAEIDVTAKEWIQAESDKEVVSKIFFLKKKGFPLFQRLF